MVVTIILGFFSVSFAYLAKYRNTHWGLKVSFSLIFLFLALRYNFGNDYKPYLNAFIEISQNNRIDIFDLKNQFEPGWIFINWVFRPFGFFAMTAVLALMNCLIYYRIIKKFVPLNYYWLAIFIYVFSPGFLLIHASAMRQSLAILLFLFSIDYLFRKDAIRYFICIGLASLIHTSAIILFPIYLLSFINWKLNRIVGGILFSIFISLFLFGKSILPFLNHFIALYFEKYSIYQTGFAVGTGLGVLYLSVLLILTLHFERGQDRETALIFKISIISFMFIPLSILILLISRAGMYFAPATILVYPIILVNIKTPILKLVFLLMLIFITTYEFINFFSTEGWRIAFGTYKTIFSAPKFY